jgi:zinc protease
MRIPARFLFIPLLLSLAAVGFSQAPPQGVQKVTSVEGITEYDLTNGLRVLLFPDQSKPKMTVNITYLVGSRYEGYGETGMAHLLEHMLFKSTPQRPDIKKDITDRGAIWNATTWYDRTNYFEIVNASDDNLKWALALEADRMLNTRIEKAILDTEMTVVRNEFERGENDPTSVLVDRTAAVAFDWHNYGKSTIGARSDIENVPIERLAAFYHKYYQPDNAILTVAGRFNEAQALQWVADTFGPIPRPARMLQPTYTTEPTQDGERSVTVRRVGDVQVLTTLFKTPAAAHPDSPALDVLTTILGDTPSGRLYKALVDSKKASSVTMDTFSLREPGYMIAIAQVRKHDVRDHRGPHQGTAHQGRSGTRQDSYSEKSRACAERFAAGWADYQRVRRRGRLAPALPESRSHQAGDGC